jgi:hypothetical protein
MADFQYRLLVYGGEKTGGQLQEKYTEFAM